MSEDAELLLIAAGRLQEVSARLAPIGLWLGAAAPDTVAAVDVLLDFLAKAERLVGRDIDKAGLSPPE